MIEQFKVLSQEEVEVMLSAPLLVTVLIAGADNEIDNSEIKEAVSIAKLKQKKARLDLIEYYKEVGVDFEDKLKVMIQQFPSKAEERNPMIISELEKLNSILPKLDKKFAEEFYASIKDIAKKIAESSGGLLGYMAVGYEESKLIGLNMIKNPA
ncbi:hypothetical protein [Fulvivirga lutea]|uniref:Uncharacterized protein n=1 Tax=Fulvivirga lutea TaxID=2810512 RepID=A0A974WE93_9BACT|nr:hypothetical protein [Fulvivirga lutea]QSE96719.1 hypothetical protein JR347_14105 [Fulvivirga lutea]